MKADKYCYELVQHQVIPTGFDPIAVAKHQQTIQVILEMEKLIRRQTRNIAQSELRGTLTQQFATDVKRAQATAQRSIKSAHQNHLQVMAQIRTNVGAPPNPNPWPGFSRYTGTVRNSQYRDANASVSHRRYDPVIEQFEQRYNSNRPNIDTIKGCIKRALPDAILLSDGNHIEISVMNSEYDSLPIAMIYTGDARFRIKRRATGETRDVYEHIGNGREYVKDANNIFVKRYVYRNMADYDDPWTNDGFRSRNGAVPNGANINDVIIRHLRAAQQGQSYFISFTTSKKRIFGSTGTEFYDPVKGQVIIDLAKIAQEKIYDVHTAQAVTGIITANELRWGMQFVEGDDDYERNAAARDTVRTRELLIEAHVPAAAIVSLRRGGRHGGAWRDLDGTVTKTSALPSALFPQ